MAKHQASRLGKLLAFVGNVRQNAPANIKGKCYDIYMNERTVADLKKFIAGAISQQTFDLRQDMSGIKQDISVMKQDIAELKNDVARVDKKIDDADSRLSAKIDSVDHKLSGKLDDLSASVAEALYVSNEAAGKQFKNHERRIARLEHKPA